MERRLKIEEPQSQLPPAAAPLPGRDVRSKRPPAFAFLLRLQTLRQFGRVAVLLLIDLGGLYLAILTALTLKAAFQSSVDFDAVVRETNRTAVLACLVTVLLFARSDLYADRTERPGFARVLASLFQVTVVVLLFAVISGQDYSSYFIFYGSLVFAVLYIGVGRLAFDHLSGTLLRAAGYHRRAVLVGTGAHIEQAAHALTDGGKANIELVGYLSLVPRADNGIRSLGLLDDLSDVLDRCAVDEVIIVDPDFPQDRAVDLVQTCHERGVKVRVVPSTMEILAHRGEFVPGQPVPLFELRSPVFEGIDFALKRVFDLIGAGLLMLVLAPLFAVIALSVRLTSRGPALFHSMRPGIGGVPFACLKFRTMAIGSQDRQGELEEFNEAGGALFKIRDDPRVTAIGRTLRRFSLDELPQLINVLRGDMSLVGPRPLPQRDFDRLEEWHKKRYLVLPGITGLWQVSGRADLDFDDLVRLDFLYLERWSIFLDLTILIKTVPALLLRRGAF